MTKPFLTALITGAVIAYLSYPLYEKILRHLKSKSLASFAVTLFVVLLFAVPSVVLLSLVSKEAYIAYTSLNTHNIGTNFLAVMCRDESSLSCRTFKSSIGFLPEEDLDFYVQSAIKKITEFIIANVSKFLSSIFSIILDFFIIIFSIYYLLKDGETIKAKIKSILPLRESQKQSVLQKFHEVTFGVFYGNISLAIVQGTLGAIGFFIFGVSSPILWGFVMMILALLPYVGTAIVWLPAAMNLIFVGYIQNDTAYIFSGIGLIVYCIIMVVFVDYFLNPKIIGTRTGVHPILVILGVLGGLSLFGFIGLILGPVMLALLMTFVDIYEQEKAELER